MYYQHLVSPPGGKFLTSRAATRNLIPGLHAFTFLIAASFGIGVPTFAQEPGEEDLVAAYAFAEGNGTITVDASGNALTGTITGAVWSESGRFGSAMSFDGSGDYVTVDDADLLNLSAGMTLQAWVYPTAGNDWRTVLLKERANGLSYALYANDDAARPATYVNVTGGGSSTLAQGSEQLPLNTWTHLAATYDGTLLLLYTNGVLAASEEETGDIVTTSHPLRIGGNLVWGEGFTGLIDEVRVHRRALTSSDIGALMLLPVGQGPGFEFILYNNPVTIGLSDAGLYNLGIAPRGGFTSWVYPTLTGLPPDSIAVFEPVDGPPHPGPFALTVNTGPTTPAGTYSLTLAGTNGVLSASTNLTLTVHADPGFRLTVEPNELIIAQGLGGVATYEVFSENGYNQLVTLSATGLPSGASATFQPSTAVPSASGMVALNVAGLTPPGTYPVLLTATDGVLTNEAVLTLTVREQNDEGSWRQLSLGDSGAKYYGVIVGDVGGTGTNRVYGSAGNGLMYEYVYDGTNWSFALMPVGESDDGQMHNMAIGPARGDGTNRLYIAAAGSGRLYEMSWVAGSWQSNLVATLDGSTDVVIGDGRNDGGTNMYVTWESGSTELTWNGAAWDQVTMSSNESGWVHGNDLADGRNDGTNRVYTANQGSGEVYEYTWTGSGWSKLPVGDTGDARNVEVGSARGDGTNRVYVASGGGNVYEFTWDGAAWQELSMGDGGTSSVKVHSIPAAARSDGVTRVYVAAGNGMYEYAWAGTAWEAEQLGSAVAYMYGLAVGDGLNNGTIQVYGSAYDGNVYLFEWLPAVVETPPDLLLSAEGDQLLLMWPISSVGYAPWFCTNMVLPDWTSISSTPVVAGAHYVVTNQPTSPTGFYQLRKP